MSAGFDACVSCDIALSSSTSVLLVAKFITSSPSTYFIFCSFVFTDCRLKPSTASGFEVALHSRA